MVVIDGVYPRQANGGAFYPTGEPHKLVGFDVANHNSQVCLGKVPVDPYWCISLGLAQVDQIGCIAGIVAHNSIAL